MTKQSAKPSPYIEEARRLRRGGGLPTGAEPRGIEIPDLAVTYSELEPTSCPQSYLLRNELGFMPPVKPSSATATPSTTSCG